MASKLISAWGVFRTFLQSLEEEITAADGSIEMLDNLAKKDMRPAIRQFAAAIIKLSNVFHLSGKFATLADAINAGGYDRLIGVAEFPTEINGVTIHDVFCDALLEYPKESLTFEQAYYRYFSDDAADLSDLAVFGVRYPDVQRKFPVAVIWKDGDELWWAGLGGHNDRGFFVDRVGTRKRLHVDFRYLIRKPSVVSTGGPL